MIAPVYGIAAFLALLAALLLGLRVYQVRWRPHPEVPRKLLHVGLGLSTLAFPWLFDRAWPVLLLSGVGLVVMTLLRTLPRLKTSMGEVVGGVKRLSLGDVCFPVAIAVLFVLHKGQPHEPLLFVIPMLVLALADTVAALIGITYGRLHYEGSDGEKTAEGSVAFFTVTFLSVHVPLLLLTDIGRSETLLIALMLGLLVMMMEAIAWRGLDNLFIPLGAYLLLRRYIPLAANDLLVRLAVTAGLVMLVTAFRKRSTLTPPALMGSALFGYAAFTLGGVLWLIPPLVLFVCHCMFWPKSTKNTSRHDVHVIIWTAGPGLLWLTLFAVYGADAMIRPFVALFAAHLAIIGVSWLPPRGFSRSKRVRLGLCVAVGTLFAAGMVGLSFLFHRVGFKPDSLDALRIGADTYLSWVLVAVILAAGGFAVILSRLVDPVTHLYRHVHHAGGVFAFLASVLVFVAGLRLPTFGI